MLASDQKKTPSAYDNLLNNFKKHDDIAFQVLWDVPESEFNEDDISAPDSDNTSTTVNEELSLSPSLSTSTDNTPVTPIPLCLVWCEL